MMVESLDLIGSVVCERWGVGALCSLETNLSSWKQI